MLKRKLQEEEKKDEVNDWPMWEWEENSHFISFFEPAMLWIEHLPMKV